MALGNYRYSAQPAVPVPEVAAGATGSLNLSLYAPEIDCETKSMLSGEHKQTVRYDELPDIKVLKAWLADDDLQYLQVVSTNSGFIRSFQKRLVGAGAANSD